MQKLDDSTLLARRALQVQRGAARASVLGVNDGLVSILCLVLAVAGAGTSSQAVLLAGFAGLLAGAVSMAAGEWISMRAQVELFGGVMKDIGRLLAGNRRLLEEQLEQRFKAEGYSDKAARSAVQDIAASDKMFVSAYARQVMGFNPDELGSPWITAGSSFVLFTVGALAPLAPWVFGGGGVAIMLSILLTGLVSLVIGGYIGASSGRGKLYGALRHLGIVIFASAITYGVGYIFGVSVG